MSSPRLQTGREAIPGAVYAVTTVVAGRRAVFADACAAGAVVDEIRLAGRMGLRKYADPSSPLAGLI